MRSVHATGSFARAITMQRVLINGIYMDSFHDVKDFKMNYTELHITTNFSFLRGGSHPEELAEQAAALGYTAIGVCDKNSVAGVVRAHAAGKKCGVRIIPGCCLDLLDGPSLLAFPANIQGWSQL